MPEVLIVLTVAWGVMSFGAVYPWAYWPLLGAAAGVGAWCLLTTRPERRMTALSVAFAIIACVIVMQLVPLPVRLLSLVSPVTGKLLREYALGYLYAPSAHALSMAPGQTALGLSCFVALAMFCAGAASRFDANHAAKVARAITILGIIVAVLGVVQKTSGTSLIYGFWKPFHHPYQIFGPFVNKNHYGGWMIMALSLTIGSIVSSVSAAAPQKRDWRGRMLWLSSPDASYVVLGLVGVPVMVTALLMTLSRSAMISFAIAASVACMCVLSRARRRTTAITLAGAYAAIAAVLVSGWSSLQAVTERLEVGSGLSLASRVWAWKDAMRILHDFPIFGTGLNTFDVAMAFYQSQPGAYWNAAHNDYVQLLAEGGLALGLAVALALLIVLRISLRRLIEEAVSDSPAFWLRLGAILGLVAIGIQECFDFSLQLPGNAVLSALLVAMAVYGPDRAEDLRAARQRN